jgi:hypothetical protein
VNKCLPRAHDCMCSCCSISVTAAVLALQPHYCSAQTLPALSCTEDGVA